MILVPLALILLSLVAGMHLLAKTQKESLGGFFKLVSYLVIGLSFLALIGGGAMGVRHMRMHHGCGMCMMHSGCPHENGCMMMHEGCMHESMGGQDNMQCPYQKTQGCAKDAHKCTMGMHDGDDKAPADSAAHKK